MKPKQKNPPVPDHHARFENFYSAREQKRIARGTASPEWLGQLEAREQIQREHEQLEAMERSWSA